MLYHGEQQLLLDTTKQITSFGEDEDGELYVVGGTVDRLVNAGSSSTPPTRFELTGGGSASFVTSGVATQISVEHAQIQPNDADAKASALPFSMRLRFMARLCSAARSHLSPRSTLR